MQARPRAHDPQQDPEQSWSPDDWRGLSAEQQPDWPDQAAVDEVLGQVAKLPPLVFAGEARTLQAALANVAAGHGFLLQAGDCAESFDVLSANAIRDKLKVILQMAGPHLRCGPAGRQGGPYRRPVRQAAQLSGRDGGRGRAAVLP